MYAHFLRTGLPWASANEMNVAMRGMVNDFIGLGGRQARLQENDDSFHLELDVPGASPDGVELVVTERQFTLNVSPSKRAASDAHARIVERATAPRRLQGSFHRPVDPDLVHATLEHGVLSLHFPKRESAKPRKINIIAK